MSITWKLPAHIKVKYSTGETSDAATRKRKGKFIEGYDDSESSKEGKTLNFWLIYKFLMINFTMFLMSKRKLNLNIYEKKNISRFCYYYHLKQSKI